MFQRAKVRKKSEIRKKIEDKVAEMCELQEICTGKAAKAGYFSAKEG